MVAGLSTRVAIDPSPIGGTDPSPKDVTAPPGGSAISEWSVARDLITKCDDRLGALRSYGLTFVAGLLTAQGLISFPVGGVTSPVPPFVRLAIVISSLILVCALYTIDRQVRSIQAGAALRARILERQLGHGLTEAVADTFKVNGAYKSIDLAYESLLLGTGVLGLAVIAYSPGSTFPVLLIILLVALALAGLYIRRVGRDTEIHDESWIDWSLKSYRVEEGGTIEVTLTNLSSQALTTPHGTPYWKLQAPGGPSGSLTEEEKPVPGGASWTWVTTLGSLRPGTYWIKFYRDLGPKEAQPPTTKNPTKGPPNQDLWQCVAQPLVVLPRGPEPAKLTPPLSPPTPVSIVQPTTLPSPPS